MPQILAKFNLCTYKTSENKYAFSRLTEQFA